jgi:hypothetical protein
VVAAIGGSAIVVMVGEVGARARGDRIGGGVGEAGEVGGGDRGGRCRRGCTVAARLYDPLRFRGIRRRFRVLFPGVVAQLIHLVQRESTSGDANVFGGAVLLLRQDESLGYTSGGGAISAYQLCRASAGNTGELKFRENSERLAMDHELAR